MRLLASLRFPGPAWDELDEVEYPDGPLAGADGAGVEALAVVGELVDDAVLDRFPDLRLVANYGVGYDAIDVAACSARGVTVTNTPGVLDAATADLALALILAARRRLIEGDMYVRSERWGSGWAEAELVGDEVSGATLGIVGLGRIGSAVARRAAGFEMRILYTQRHRLDAETEQRLGLDFFELDDLIAESEVVTVHVPLTPETRGLIDRSRLALLPDGATFVNTARGAVVDEDALVAELVSGRIRAGLDVFAHEPRVPPELLELPNVVLTPHLGSATTPTREAMTRVLVDNVLVFAAGRTPSNVVN